MPQAAALVIDEQIGVADAQAPRSNDGNRMILTLLIQLDINNSNVRIMRAVKQNGKCSCKSRRIKVASVVHQHRHVHSHAVGCQCSARKAISRQRQSVLQCVPFEACARIKFSTRRDVFVAGNMRRWVVLHDGRAQARQRVILTGFEELAF